MIAALLILVAALAYIVHERLDLARFNSQARGSALPSAPPAPAQDRDDGKEARDGLAMPARGNTICNPHPAAPHGFNRTASHNAGRYVCYCEGWMPPGRLMQATTREGM